MRRVDIRENLLRNLYINQHLTTYQIAEKLGFCQGTIWKRLKEYKIITRLSYAPVSFTKEHLKTWYLDQKLSTWKIEKRFGHSRGTIHRKLKEFGLSTRNIAVSHIRFPRANFSGDILEKAYLMGFRIGDLNVTKRGIKSETIVVKCASTKQGQLELFRNLFSKYGHILEGKLTKEGRINIQANLNLSFSFLLDKSPDSYKWAFDNKKIFFAFLAGFTDAEGSFFISQGRGVFAIGNYDKPLLLKIKQSLNEFGIGTPQLSVYYREQRKTYNGYRSKSDYHTLTCSKKVSLIKLLSLLGPHIKHPDKINKTRLIKNNMIERNFKFGNINM